jgi:hypothetical protein
MELFELQDELWEGLPEEDEASTWNLIDQPRDRPRPFPKRYTRWYLTYHKPTCQTVWISADRNPKNVQ